MTPRGRSGALPRGGALRQRDAPPHSHSVAHVSLQARGGHLCVRVRTCECQAHHSECRDGPRDVGLGGLHGKQLDAHHGERLDGHHGRLLDAHHSGLDRNLRNAYAQAHVLALSRLRAFRAPVPNVCQIHVIGLLDVGVRFRAPSPFQV